MLGTPTGAEAAIIDGFSSPTDAGTVLPLVPSVDQAGKAAKRGRSLSLRSRYPPAIGALALLDGTLHHPCRRGVVQWPNQWQRATLLNGQMKPASAYRLALKLVSLDIETTAYDELYSIALEGCGQRQVVDMLEPANGSDASLDFYLEYCVSRRQILERLNQWLEQYNPYAIRAEI